ncbi:Iron-sulfur cluster-binding protein [Rhodovastum atsumiense]|uniref:Epoxyqueuosine reductase n=1 Tax=Rhodovastum atsumiense TaxID=504468 RepID=A0A5M6J210_9PROT|nr:epoxyqueuosine reductase [Rhodovastum atsumiense]KAA5614571.1 epoxyqueuosine reductase [Rhodovastum atsumiense]CAH2599936.1 Iron-sulfur cluster-binding protein [Rhodovastum atsumiense]
MSRHGTEAGSTGDDGRTGFLSLRFGRRGTDPDTLTAFLTELVATDPRNVLPEGDNVPIWDAPVVGIAAADDALFAKLKEPGVVGPIHENPEYWLPGARAVVSFFLPFSHAVKRSYDRHSHLPSLEWVSGRLNGEVFVNLARRALAAYLRAEGGRAVVPNLQAHYRAVNHIPMWSERHVAFIAGVGTFGLHAGLLTAKGAAGRIGSVVTDLPLVPTPRAYSEVYEYCPWFTDRSCGACIARCPVGAVHETGKDHAICLTNGRDHIRPAYAEWGYHSCGHCQNNLPCSNGIPPGARRAATPA